MNIKDRGDDLKCLCCDGKIDRKPTLTSFFLSKRAWGGEAEWSTTSKCRFCGFAFHGRGLSENEVAKYYLNYRDDTYFTDRNASEPFYTRKVHNKLTELLDGKPRREALAVYLATQNELFSNPVSDLKILDFAGGSGHLIQDLPGKKFVYDVSGEDPVENVSFLSESNLRNLSFDLVVCAQMLEHATDPVVMIRDLFKLVKPGGVLYIEVPYDETWRDFSGGGRIRDWVLGLAKRNGKLNLLLDVYGTAFRVKLKILPPFAFVPVREHLNYFTVKSLRSLGQNIDATVIDASRQKILGTVLLLRK
jgi:SAM-dependent methyltransferase